MGDRAAFPLEKRGENATPPVEGRGVVVDPAVERREAKFSLWGAEQLAPSVACGWDPEMGELDALLEAESEESDAPSGSSSRLAGGVVAAASCAGLVRWPESQRVVRVTAKIGLGLGVGVKLRSRVQIWVCVGVGAGGRGIRVRVRDDGEVEGEG